MRKYHYLYIAVQVLVEQASTISSKNVKYNIIFILTDKNQLIAGTFIAVDQLLRMVDNPKCLEIDIFNMV